MATNPPAVVELMLRTPGLYLVGVASAPELVARVWVDDHGHCHQLADDGLLGRDGWRDDTTVRGPINFNTPLMGL